MRVDYLKLDWFFSSGVEKFVWSDTRTLVASSKVHVSAPSTSKTAAQTSCVNISLSISESELKTILLKPLYQSVCFSTNYKQTFCMKIMKLLDSRVLWQTVKSLKSDPRKSEIKTNPNTFLRKIAALKNTQSERKQFI